MRNRRTYTDRDRKVGDIVYIAFCGNAIEPDLAAFAQINCTKRKITRDKTTFPVTEVNCKYIVGSTEHRNVNNRLLAGHSYYEDFLYSTPCNPASF